MIISVTTSNADLIQCVHSDQLHAWMMCVDASCKVKYVYMYVYVYVCVNLCGGCVCLG